MTIPPGRIPPRAPEKLTELEMHLLLPHLVNLTAGNLSRDGEASTTRADVDRIFTEHLPAFLRERESEPAAVVFYAHGGLVDEKGGLRYAVNHVQWWKDNGVYPVFFVWETGLWETLYGILREWFPPRRGLVVDEVSDRVIEGLARGSRAGDVWGRMKDIARRAAEEGGGSRYVAQRLASFTEKYPDIPLHAVGHSAGAIFHSHFIPAALDAGIPLFESLSMLAPAVRIDHFQATLLNLIGEEGPVRRASIFTMNAERERDDRCVFDNFPDYKKSLLYLIHYGLEPQRETPLLGLEESFHRAGIGAVFGEPAEGHRSSAEVIWSDGREPDQRPLDCQSNAASHDAFDNNRLTMESVVRRITGSDQIVPYPQWLEDTESAFHPPTAFRPATAVPAVPVEG